MSGPERSKSAACASRERPRAVVSAVNEYLMTPAEVATLLQVEPSTLRRWALHFADLLSPRAQKPTVPGTQRVYSEADVELLGQVQRLLGEGHTTAHVREQLSGAHDRVHTATGDAHDRVQTDESVVHDHVHTPIEAISAPHDDVSDAHDRVHASTETVSGAHDRVHGAHDRAPTPEHQVLILDERPEIEALRQLLTAQRTTLEAQQATLHAQSQLIAQLQLASDQGQHEMDQLRDQLKAERATWSDQRANLERDLGRTGQQLEQARSDEAAALASLRLALVKIPRWLRALLGLGA